MRKERVGFSLVELLVVVAMIAILSALLFPAIRAALQNARRAKAISSMRQIAWAYMHYVYHSGNGTRDIVLEEGSTAHDWIKVLAGQGYFNDPRLVMFDFDYLVRSNTAQASVLGTMGWILGIIPRHIYDVSRQGLDEAFLGKPLSIVVAAGTVSAYPEHGIPVCWTRGLNEQGYWNESQGPQGGVFGTSGGVVAFTDGSARWFDDLHGKDHLLYKWGTEELTFNIFECFGPGTLVLDWQGPLHSDVAVSPALGQEEDIFSPENDDAENTIPSGPAPAYESLAVNVDFEGGNLRDMAEACGVEDVLGGILDVYGQLEQGSSADNASVDAGIETAFEAFVSSLDDVGISFISVLDDETRTMYWSGFLGDDGMDYTDNQDVFGRNPIEDAQTVLITLENIDTALSNIYGALDETQKSQFTAIVGMFSSGDSSMSVDTDSDGAKLARAYLANQMWMAAMRRTISGGTG